MSIYISVLWDLWLITLFTFCDDIIQREISNWRVIILDKFFILTAGVGTNELGIKCENGKHRSIILIVFTCDFFSPSYSKVKLIVAEARGYSYHKELSYAIYYNMMSSNSDEYFLLITLFILIFFVTRKKLLHPLETMRMKSNLILCVNNKYGNDWIFCNWW